MRRLPPVYSPISLPAIIRASGAACERDRASASRLAEYLASRFQADEVRLTGNGTQALQVAMGLLPRGGAARPVVALPAYSCFDLVSAAVGAGVDVRFYDLDPNTLSPDLDTLGGVLRKGVTAVIAGSLHGYPVDWDAVSRACSKYGVILIEDAAQGVGTLAGDRIGGAIGSMTALSFGRGKGWTGGGGGALLVRGGVGTAPATRPLESQSEAGGFRAFVVTLAAWALGRPWMYGLPASVPQLGLGETRYHDPVAPATITNFSSSLALSTAVPAEEAAGWRRLVAQRWRRAFLEADPSLRAVSPCEPVGGAGGATFLRFAVVLGDGSRRGSILRLVRRLGVEAGYPVALDRLPQAQSLRVDQGRGGLPGSAQLASNLITLPTHHWVTDRDIERAVALISHE